MQNYVKFYIGLQIKRIFAHELKVMSNLGRHLNICNLLGAITKLAIKRKLL